MENIREIAQQAIYQEQVSENIGQELVAIAEKQIWQDEFIAESRAVL